MSTMTGSLPGLPPHSGLILYRMDVDEYESLSGAGVLKDPRVELIDGYLVRKMTKKPRHTIITEWLRDRLAETLPPGWHVRKEEPVRIPSFDEPEPDLTVARGGIKDYSDRHPGPADIADGHLTATRK